MLQEDISNLPVSLESMEIMDTARLLAIYSTSKERMGIRHLFAAILMVGRKGTLGHIKEVCSSMGLSLHELAEKFIEHALSAFPKDDSYLWASQFRTGVMQNLEKLEKAPRPPVEEQAAPEAVETEQKLSPEEMELPPT